MNSVLIVGCGDIGRRIARQLDDVPVQGVARSEENATKNHELGIQPLIADLDSGQGLDQLHVEGRTVFYLAPPAAKGEQDLRMARFIETLGHEAPARLVYISTTGVYGNCEGNWVNESWPENPIADRAIRRWDAEQRLMTWAQEKQFALMRLRVGGIYAPDRLPEARIRKGLTVICPEQAPWSNRIHADDLATVCIAAAEKGRAGELYNAVDGQPTTMTDYFYRAADYLGLPRPSCATLDEADEKLTPAMLSFVRESRRLDNTKILQELGVTLKYPGLDDGLRRQGSSG
jgi:nucleoside-diphosphate-sugar epimerase